MILAAGFGTRARPLTTLRAKPALPVLNRPLLDWTLEWLASHGTRQVVINTHHLAHTVREAAGGAARFGMEIRFSHERRILGTGGGPRNVRGFFGRVPFLLLNGDMLMSFDLGKLVERHRKSGARVTLALQRNPNPTRYSSVVAGRDGRIRAIAGRPAQVGGASGLFAGVHVLDPALLESLPARGPCDTVRDLYIPMLAAGESVHAAWVRGLWLDIGTPLSYLDAQLALLERGRAVIHASAQVADGARIRRSAVGAEARVGPAARIEDSVIWDGAEVGPGADVRRAIVTSGARVRSGERIHGRVVLPVGTRPRSVTLGR
jgi:NDP-sugar pyrophosphorylase family protein